MSLNGAFEIGRSALTASQLAVQVAGNNMANAATPGFTRQVAYLTPSRADGSNTLWQVGTGVRVRDVRRQIDTALQARLWNGVSEEAAARQTLSTLSQVESTLAELGDEDLSSQLSAFFNSWSDRANLNQSSAVVVAQGQRVAGLLQRTRSDIVNLRRQMDDQLIASVQAADALLNDIARLNGAIADTEGGGAAANTLRDQRDAAIASLSQMMDVSAVEQPAGHVDILVGSTPIVLGTDSRGLVLDRRSEGGETVVSVRVQVDGELLGIASGSIGALIADRTATIHDTIESLDQLASQLIFEVNRLHSTGANAAWLRTTSGTLAIPFADRSVALNNPDNTTFSSLPFSAMNGGFYINVRNSTTGSTTSTRIDIDLDGRTALGAPGFDDDTTLEDIAGALDAAAGIQASIATDGRLSIEAEDGFEFSFSDDSSGVLAVLGVNAFFMGNDATSIDVAGALVGDPDLLAVGRIEDGVFVENANALRITSLQDQALDSLGGATVRSYWSGAVQVVGVRTAGAASAAQSASLVRENLESQRAGLSGVSMDEETINLLSAQRSYQGAARYLTAVDQLTQELINLL